MIKKFLVDASFLVPAIRTNHDFHQPCYDFLMDNEDAEWIIPDIAYFEFQATQSRKNRGENNPNEPYRNIYWPNTQQYFVSQELMKKAWELDLFNRFDRLKGADLIYACIAKVECIPLVTRDNDFKKYNQDITIINPANSEL